MKKFMFLLLVLIAACFTTCKDPANSSGNNNGDTETSGDNTDYTITFDNGPGATGGPAAVTAKYNKPMPTLTGSAPTKTSYYFDGYFENQNGGGTQYYKDNLQPVTGRVWDKQASATLYAKWTTEQLVTITFHNGTATPTTQQIQINTSALLKKNTFERAGYNFTGWAKTENGAKEYDDEALYTATDDADLYAVWAGKKYTVSFNNGSGTGGQSASVEVTFGEPMPGITSLPTVANSMFTGYWDTSTGGKKYYNADGTSAADWDKDATVTTTLYAQFVSFPAAPPTTPAVQSVVSLVQSTTVTQASSLAATTPENYNTIKALVTEAINLAGGLNGIVKTGDVVVLKPNIICTTYNWAPAANSAHIPETMSGVCTDWRVTQAVAEIVRGIVGPYNSTTGAGKIMVIEGPGKGTSATPSDTSHHFTNVGYTLTNLTFVNEIINLDSEGAAYSKGDGTNHTAYSTQITLPGFVYNAASGAYLDYYKNDGKYWVNKKMLEADVLIDLPVVKSHWNATVTGAIKNIGIGAPPARIYGISATDVGRNNMVNHASTALQDWIVDYFSCLPADFVVMDGLQGFENGPLSGTSATTITQYQKNLRCILASKDPLAIDMVSAAIIGADYNTIPYLTKLTTKGQVYARGEIGKANPRMITLRGNAKDIVVVGNKKVDDVRGSYNLAVMTGNPGKNITEAQKTPPTVSITAAAFSGTKLNLALALSSGDASGNGKVVKIDVYIDGAYKGSFNDAGLTGVSLEAADLAAGAHNVEVRAFTDYMYSAVATETVTK